MRSGWTRFQLRLALIWRALLIDFSNFYLVQHRHVSGFLMSGKNSGTHWLRHMLSHAMAHRYAVPPPAHSSGRQAGDFIGDPGEPRKYPHLPFIAVSHNLPSSILAWGWFRWLFDLPPVVVLVREPKEAMLSHYVKWREVLSLGLHDYICNSSTKRKQVADGWWYIDFFNRWGRMAKAAPGHVLVVRYEDLQAAPEYWLERVSDHLGLGLDASAIKAALQVSSREAVRSTLDPAYGEAIVPDAGERANARLGPVEEAFLARQLEDHLQHDYGYGYVRAADQRRAAQVRGLGWAKAGFVLAVAYALFAELGRPCLSLDLPRPWSQVELTAVFLALAALGPQSFPRLKGVTPALLSGAGGLVEWAQHWRVAPGVGSLSDLTAEVVGVGVASAIMLLAGIGPWARPAASRAAISSTRFSSAAPEAEARLGRHPQ